MIRSRAVWLDRRAASESSKEKGSVGTLVCKEIDEIAIFLGLTMDDPLLHA